MAEKDLYADLGVSRGASADEIRSAYRKLAREHHPDVNPNNPAAEERFKEVSFAYDVLSDEDKRARYDEFGMQGLEPGFDPEQARAYQRWQEGARRSPFSGTFHSEVDLDDLLSGMGGFGPFQRGEWRSAPLRGRDLVSEVSVDLLDAALGREVRFSVAGRDSLRVRIPPGARDGTRVRLAGQGEPGVEGGPAGDLYLTLKIRPHPVFRRTGDDLELELPVTLPELIRGAQVEVPTPDGRAQLRIPPGSRPGQRLRLRDKGALRRDGRTRGHLLAVLVPVLPEGDSAELETIARDLEPLYAGQDVRAALRRAG